MPTDDSSCHIRFMATRFTRLLRTFSSIQAAYRKASKNIPTCAFAIRSLPRVASIPIWKVITVDLGKANRSHVHRRRTAITKFRCCKSSHVFFFKYNTPYVDSKKKIHALDIYVRTYEYRLESRRFVCIPSRKSVIQSFLMWYT